jgi:hypothetical protein
MRMAVMPNALHANSLTPARLLVSGLLATQALCGASQAWAGRPLATEDAGANPQGQCQLEAWVDAAAGAKASHLAPACGLVEGLELGLEWVHAAPRAEQAQERAAALKWAPESLTWHDWRFGAKLITSQEKAAQANAWHQASLEAQAIASLALSPEWTMHLNVGRARNKIDQTSANTYGAALVWAPAERWMLFAEVNGDNRSPAAQSAGVRWWLLPEQLGLDLTASRVNATTASRSWGLGLGWYGIKF